MIISELPSFPFLFHDSPIGYQLSSMNAYRQRERQRERELFLFVFFLYSPAVFVLTPLAFWRGVGGEAVFVAKLR